MCKKGFPGWKAFFGIKMILFKHCGGESQLTQLVYFALFNELPPISTEISVP
jgi:hypothetical protein